MSLEKLKLVFNEMRYSLPHSGVQAFADFYTLEYLYSKAGTGRSGRDPGKVPTESRQRVIDDVTDACARSLGKALIEEVVRASWGELDEGFLGATKQGEALMEQLKEIFYEKSPVRFRDPPDPRWKEKVRSLKITPSLGSRLDGLLKEALAGLAEQDIEAVEAFIESGVL